MEKPIESSVTLSLTVSDGVKALEFYTKALGAEELCRMPMPDGSIAHAEFMLGNTRVYLSEESPDWQAFAMPEGAVASCIFGLGAEDCDEAYDRAINAGSTSIDPPTDQFWGFRTAVILDPFGYRWNLRKQFEEVSPEEMMKRAQALMGE